MVTGQSAMRAADAKQLPRYANPPVVEVAISVQFDELAEFQLVHFGLFWEWIRDRYPRTEHHPPLPATIEIFGQREPQPSAISIESNFPIGRCWYLSEDGLRLVQLQPDRFVLNWRKLDTETAYPSYDALRAVFDEELGAFLQFLAQHDIGEFEPRQCELTYVNHIVDEGWRYASDLPNVLTTWSGKGSSGYLPGVEDVRLAWSYRFEEGGTPLGRLHVAVSSAMRSSDRKPLVVVQLVGRGAPIGGGKEGALMFADRAHEWIVRGFTDITTQRMHAIWGRER